MIPTPLQLYLSPETETIRVEVAPGTFISLDLILTKYAFDDIQATLSADDPDRSRTYLAKVQSWFQHQHQYEISPSTAYKLVIMVEAGYDRLKKKLMTSLASPTTTTPTPSPSSPTTASPSSRPSWFASLISLLKRKSAAATPPSPSPPNVPSASLS